jgi:hypothetical protein
MTPDPEISHFEFYLSLRALKFSQNEKINFRHGIYRGPHPPFNRNIGSRCQASPHFQFPHGSPAGAGDPRLGMGFTP